MSENISKLAMDAFSDSHYETIWDNFEQKDVDLYVGWMREHMQDFFKIARQFGVRSVIEGACGPGFNLKLIKDAGFDVTGFDLNVKPSKRANLRGIPLLAGDLENMENIQNSAFDASIALGIIHSLDDEAVVHELDRISKKIVFVGVYGTKGALFMRTEPVVRWLIRCIPYKLCEALMKKTGFSSFKIWLLLDWAYLPKLKRYNERQVQDLFKEGYYCFIKRYGSWINCIAVKKECFEKV